MHLMMGNHLEKHLADRDILFFHFFSPFTPVGNPQKDKDLEITINKIIIRTHEGEKRIFLFCQLHNHLPFSLQCNKLIRLQVLLGGEWYPVIQTYYITLEYPSKIQSEGILEFYIPLFSDDGTLLPFGRYRVVWESEAHGQDAEFLWTQAALDGAVSGE